MLPKTAISQTIEALEQQWTKNLKANLSFIVVSDIHIARLNAIRHFSILLKDNFNSKPDAMVVVGDLGDGLPRDYHMLRNELGQHKIGINYPIFWTIGNHEFYGGFYRNGLWSPKTFPNKETDALAIERFLSLAGRDRVYGDTWIKDYHFIFLGSEKSRMSDRSYVDWAYLSNTQLNWLENALNKNKKRQKPIFVFLHQPLPYTTLGGFQRGFVIQWQMLNHILSQHPEVILFNGHTHYEIDYKNMVSKGNYPILNSSSLAYPIDRNRNHIMNSAQGLVIEVYNEKVVIKGRDYLKQEWISAAEISLPEGRGS
jgi:Predicted phosphohydrolases